METITRVFKVTHKVESFYCSYNAYIREEQRIKSANYCGCLGIPDFYIHGTDDEIKISSTSNEFISNFVKYDIEHGNLIEVTQ